MAPCGRHANEAICLYPLACPWVDPVVDLTDSRAPLPDKPDFACVLKSGFFLTFSKKLNSPKNSTIFQAKTQRTGSNNSHMNFKTHFIFSTFVVNEQKVLLFAQSVQKIAIFGAFLPDFPPKKYFFQHTNLRSSKLQGF